MLDDVKELVQLKRKLGGVAWMLRGSFDLVSSGTYRSLTETATERFGLRMAGVSKHISVHAGAVSALTEVLGPTLQELDALDVLLDIEVRARRELCTRYDGLSDKQRSAASTATYTGVCFTGPEALMWRAREIKESLMWFKQTWSPIQDAYADLAQTASAVDQRLHAYLDSKRQEPRHEITVEELHTYCIELQERALSLHALRARNADTISAMLSGVADVGEIDMHKQ